MYLKYLAALTRSLPLRLLAVFDSRKLAVVIYNAQKFITKIYQHQLPPKACKVLHMGLSPPVVLYTDTPNM